MDVDAGADRGVASGLFELSDSELIHSGSVADTLGVWAIKKRADARFLPSGVIPPKIDLSLVWREDELVARLDVDVATHE